MRSQLDDNIINTLSALKGMTMQLCRYKHGDYSPNDGFVLCGASDYYFIEARTKVIDDKYELYLLVVTAVTEDELDEDVHFDVIWEGELSDVHVFYHVLSGIQVKGQMVPDISSECAMMIGFDGINKLIYPGGDFVAETSIEEDTDKILDVISDLKLQHSRTL